MKPSPSVPAAADRAIRYLLPLTVLIPLIAFVAIGAYRCVRVVGESEQRVERSLQIAHEHALRVLDTAEGLLDRVQDAVNEELRTEGASSEQALHRRLAAMAQGRAQLQGLFVMDKAGKLVANSRFFPSPPVSVADRESFKWHQAGHDGIFLSRPLVSRSTQEPFFDLSVARRNAAGAFAGVISVSLSPKYFQGVHSEIIADEPGLAINMFRDDGSIFSRTPPVAGAPDKLGADGPVMTLLRAGLADGRVNGVSSVDGVHRLIAFRRVSDFPLYVGTGMSRHEVLRRWGQEMLWVLGFGIPPFVALFWVTRLALARTRQTIAAMEQRRHHEEALRRAEAALSEQTRLEALGRLTGGVAHDFNNALMVLANNLYLLRRKAPELGLPQLDAMSRAVDSATQLTRRLLTFSRGNAAAPQRVRLQEAIPHVAKMLRSALGTHHELEIDVASDTHPICIESTELDAALLNLVINARDAMPDGGRVTLRVGNVVAGLPPDLSGPFVSLTVADGGVGIAPAVLPHVFEPFFTTKPVGQGTGLGLSQVYGICKRAGGRALIESEPGQGTAVRLLFPASDAPEASDSGASDDLPVARSGVLANVTVLLAEDNDEVAAALIPALERLGSRVTRVASASAAMDALARANPLHELLLTDIIMPGPLDGGSLAYAARAKWPALQIIVMSGYASNLQQLEQDGFAVLIKPFTPEQLERVYTHVAGPSGKSR